MIGSICAIIGRSGEETPPVKPKYAIIAALAGAAYAAPAMAQELPTWRPDAACARETSDRAFCMAFEGEA